MKTSLQSCMEIAINSRVAGDLPSRPSLVLQDCAPDFSRQGLFFFSGCDGCRPFFYLLIKKSLHGIQAFLSRPLHRS